MTDIVFPTLSRNSAESLEFGLRSNTQVSTSDLSGQVQTVELPGARWTMSFRFPSLSRADSDLMSAFLAKLRGQANRATVPVFGRRTPSGTWAGSPVVDNEAGSPAISQTGNTLVCKSFTAGATVKAGDLFNLGASGQLLMVVADGTADGSGKLTMTIEPAIRTAPAHGTALDATYPVVPKMIPSDPHLKWTLLQGALADFSFDLVEVF